MVSHLLTKRKADGTRKKFQIMSNGSINLMRSFVVSKLTLTSSFIVFWLLDESKWCKKREFQTQIVQQGKHMRNAALKENYFFSSNENLNDHLSAFSLQLFLSLICLWAACRSCCHCWTSLHLSRILTCVFFLAPFCRFYYTTNWAHLVII